MKRPGRRGARRHALAPTRQTGDLGIVPDLRETGYGYIRRGDKVAGRATDAVAGGGAVR